MRVRANGLVNKRLRLGLIVRPVACQLCRRVCRPDAHHPDYGRPDLVVWVCRSCHIKAHHRRAVAGRAMSAARSIGAVDRRRSHPHAKNGGTDPCALTV